MITFRYRGQEWFWNGFQSFFFQPVSWPSRKKERIVKSGALYDALRAAANYP